MLGVSGGWVGEWGGVIDGDKLQLVSVSCLRPCADLLFKSKENRKKFEESAGYQAHTGLAGVHADPARRSGRLSHSALSRSALQIRFCHPRATFADEEGMMTQAET